MAAAGYGRRVEGIHAAEAALAAGRVIELRVERRRAGRGEVGRLAEKAAEAGVPVTVVEDLGAETAAPQGVAAVCRPIAAVALDELVAMASPASLVVVDHVEDPHNLGAMVRSAVAAGIPRMLIAGRRSAPLGASAFKSAAGALERCAVTLVSSVAQALRRLEAMGVWTVGLDARAERSVFGLELLAEPVALVVGGETGLHRLVRERVDVVAAIPMAGPVESLNASVAAALACFEVMRIRGGR